MVKPRVTATDRLANVIEVVELGQRTGLLLVERGSGSVMEEGAIYFLSGRVIYAALAGLRGREALSALSRWGGCRFAFDRDAPRPVPNVSGQLPSMDAPRSSQPRTPPSQPSQGGSRPGTSSIFGSSTPSLGAGSGAWQVPQDFLNELLSGNNNGANSTTGSGASYGNGANTYPNPNSRSYPASASPNPPSYADPGGQGMFGQRQGGPGQMGQTGQMQRGPNTGYLPNQAPSNGRIPIGTTPLSDLYAASRVLDRRPRRAPDVRDLMTVVTNYNLTRSHRTILLLADGEHSVVDLARLSSKSVEEVVMLLNELETRGLIYYYDS